MTSSDSIPIDSSTETRSGLPREPHTEAVSQTRDLKGPGAAADTDMAIDLPRFGPFELIDLLGHGGMGVVFKARDNLGRIVAVKKLLAGAASHPQHRERFETEAMAIAQLDHPNIVPIYQFELNGNEPFFAMKYLDGGSLSQKRAALRGDGRAVAAIVAKVARAVQHAHDRRIIHRDLKPSNIFLDERGEPMVGDFGLAKLLDGGEEMTQTGAVLGTPAYMAPEQRDGRIRDLGFGCDVWALGVTLQELATGRRPGDTSAASSKARPGDATPPPTPPPLPLDAGLAAIAGKCLQHRPEDRYRSAGAMADDLEAWLRGEFRPPRRLSKRRRAILTAGIAVVLIWAAFAFVWTRFIAPQDELERMQQELSQGEIQLLRPDGMPRWHEKVFGDVVVKPSAQGSDRVLTLSSGKFALVELMPNPAQSHFRLHADVRMDDRVEGAMSEAGIYVGRSRVTTADSQIHCLARFGVEERVIPGQGGDKLRQTGWLAFKVQFCYRGTVTSTPSREVADPKIEYVIDADPWHPLTMELSPLGIQTPAGQGPPVTADRGDLLQLSGKIQSGQLDLSGAKPSFEGTDGVGLFVGQGKASFRNVWIERVQLR